ncbi:hypothetical protein JR316_0013223 [Psilocybe cubensis]|uniref:Uncharacterized protein n=1 Tax=Psilocybe cubensis TaxID=181762 RepID=A0ACB8GGP2_PSICU|nr:hypothetical protein JR316_0013223 [Psilocybe cubensis]KAH9474758.1 hypothetical protein JR316_0013223 [Psilocybe cubensis]
MKHSQKKAAARKGAQSKNSAGSPPVGENDKQPATNTSNGQSNPGTVIDSKYKESTQNHPSYSLDEEAERILLLDEQIHDSGDMDHNTKVALMNEFFQQSKWQSRYEIFMKSGCEEVADNSECPAK